MIAALLEGGRASEWFCCLLLASADCPTLGMFVGLSIVFGRGGSAARVARKLRS